MRYKTGEGKRFRHQVIDEPANGLILSMPVGQSVKITIGNEEVEVILWGSNTKNQALCFRSKREFNVDRNWEKRNGSHGMDCSIQEGRED